MARKFGQPRAGNRLAGSKLVSRSHSLRACLNIAFNKRFALFATVEVVYGCEHDRLHHFVHRIRTAPAKDRGRCRASTVVPALMINFSFGAPVTSKRAPGVMPWALNLFSNAAS